MFVVLVSGLATLMSAVLYGLCFPPTRWQALAWVAQVPFLIAVRRSHTGVALVLGWLFTVTVAYTTGDWLPRAVASYYQQPAALGVAFFFAVSSIMAAPYVMVFAACYQRLARLPGAVVPLLVAAAWIAQELARITILTGNPWATFGYSQVGLAPLVQIADVTGVYGVSFVLVVVNVALAEIALSMMARADLRSAVVGLAIATVTAAGVVGYGALRLRSSLLSETEAPPVEVGIIQGNLDLSAQWRSEFYGRNLDTYLRLTQEALVAAHPQLVFWPESAMTFFLEEEPLYRAAIGHLLQASDTQLLAGGPREIASAHHLTFYNSAFLVAPDGRILATYDKQHLLPFAEYFPFAQLDFLRRRFERVREFTPGVDTPPLPTVAGRAGILICNEAMFPEPAAARVAAGAQYLVNPANDTWLGDRKYSEQVFDIVSLRAVEQRRYLVRTSTAGPSAIVDPYGRVAERTEPFTQTWIAGTIAPRNATTVYSRVGDLFAALCALAAVIGTVVGSRRRP